MSGFLLPQALCTVLFPLPQMLCSQSFVWLIPLHPSDFSSNIASLERLFLQMTFCPMIKFNHTRTLFHPLTEMFYVFVSPHFFPHHYLSQRAVGLRAHSPSPPPENDQQPLLTSILDLESPITGNSSVRTSSRLEPA